MIQIVTPYDIKPVSVQKITKSTKSKSKLGKSTKTAATRAALFDSNTQQIVCRLGLCPRPHWGAYSAPPDLLAVVMGPTSKGEEGTGEEDKEKSAPMSHLNDS